MKKNYNKIKLKSEVTLGECVLILMGHATKGEFVYAEFEGHKFYSDTVSMNSAYQKVYGKTYYEMLASQVVEVETADQAEMDEKTEQNSAVEAQQQGENAEAELEVPLSELEIRGRECIHQKYWDAWRKCVELYEGNEEKEKDLDICLSIISAIDENDLQLEKAMTVIKNLDFEKERLYEILDIVETFGDKGYYISKKARASKGFRKTTVSGEENYSIYIDRDTRCQYLWIKSGSAGGLQLIVNADGTPKLYEGDVD